MPTYKISFHYVDTEDIEITVDDLLTAREVAEGMAEEMNMEGDENGFWDWLDIQTVNYN